MTKQAWMSMPQWDACAEPSLKEERFAGARCIVAFAAAQRRDFVAKVKLFFEDGHYFVFARHYTSEVHVRCEGELHLKAWAQKGWIRMTSGPVLDLEAVREELLGSRDGRAHGDRQRFQIDETVLVSGQLTQFVQLCGATMSEIELIARKVSPVMRELEDLVACRRLHHVGDPVLAWAISSVLCRHDALGGIVQITRSESGRIDSAVALILALTCALARRSLPAEVLVV